VLAVAAGAVVATVTPANATIGCTGGTGCSHQTTLYFNGTTVINFVGETKEWWGPFTVLKLQDDGNLVLYCQGQGSNAAVWASNTAHPRPSWDDGFDGSELHLEYNGNLSVWWDYVNDNPVEKWSSGTGPKGWEAIVQADGNFVIYDEYGAPLWTSGTYRKCPGTGGYWG
jgi:hypothetical protein